MKLQNRFWQWWCPKPKKLNTILKKTEINFISKSKTRNERFRKIRKTDLNIYGTRKSKPNPEIRNKKLISKFRIDFKFQNFKISKTIKSKNDFPKILKTTYLTNDDFKNSEATFTILTNKMVWNQKPKKNFQKKTSDFLKTKSGTKMFFFQKQKIENNFSKSENRKLTCMQSNIKNRFWKSESEIEIQNFLKPKNQNRFSKSNLLKTKPEIKMQIFLNPKNENWFSKFDFLKTKSEIEMKNVKFGKIKNRKSIFKIRTRNTKFLESKNRKPIFEIRFTKRNPKTNYGIKI